MKILDTERLSLRVLETADAPFYLQLVTDRSFIDNCGDKGVRTLEGAREMIEQGPRAMQQRLGYSAYLVERRSDGAPIGLCGLIKRDILPDADIGYAIAPPYWGQGYAYEAGVAVVTHARAIGLKRLLGITDPDNHASNHLLKKLGLNFVQLAMLEGRDTGTNLYALEFPA